MKMIALLFVLSSLTGACASLEDEIANDCNEAQCDEEVELKEEYQRFHKIQIDIQRLLEEDADKSFNHPMSLTYTSFLGEEKIFEELVFFPNNDELFKETHVGDPDVGDNFLNGRFTPFLNLVISDEFVAFLQDPAPARCDGIPYSIALRIADRNAQHVADPNAQHELAPEPITGFEAPIQLVNPNYESQRYVVCLDEDKSGIMDVFSSEWGRVIKKYLIDYYNRYDTTTNT